MDYMRCRGWRYLYSLSSGKSEDYENNNYLHQDKIPVKISRNTKWILCYVLIGLTSILCYVNNIYGDFVHDDIKAITTNPDVRGETSLLTLFTNDFWGKSLSHKNSHKSYRPVCVLTFRFNYLLGELNPVGYHITNNILHCIATLLFTHICRRVIFCGDIFLSALAGVMFAVHPIHTEAVSGLVGRAEILSCLFFLLGFITYHSGSNASGLRPVKESQRSASVFWPMICATFALLSKEQGITVLGLCIMYDIYSMWQRLKYDNSDFPRGVRRIAKTAISLLFLVLFRLWVLRGSFPIFQEEDNPASFSRVWLTRVLTYTYLWSFNGWLMVCPVYLSHDWQMGSIPLVESLWDARNIASLFTLVLLFAIIWKLAFKEKLIEQSRLFFGLVLTVLPFILASNIFIAVGFVVAERVLYMPSMGVIVLVVSGVDSLRRVLPSHWPHLKVFSITVLVLVPACRTLIRNKVWRNRHNLTRSGIEVLPNNAKLHYNYANLLADVDHIEGAIHHYRIAISLWPGYASAHNNLAYHVTNTTEAMYHLTEAIRLAPCHANAHTNMANIYHRSQNNTEKAIDLLQFAIECDITNPTPHLSLAAIYHDQGETSLADRQYRIALELAPTQAHVHHNMGLLYEANGEHRSAIKHLEKAVSLDPYNHISIRTLARLYRILGQNEQSQSFWIRALGVSRDHITLDMAGSFYFNIGQISESIELFQEAYTKGQHNEAAILHLTQALTSLERYVDAAGLLKKHIPDYPRNRELTLQLANVYGLCKQHTQAINLLDTFVGLSETDLSNKELSIIYYHIGNHNKDLKQLDIAVSNYHKATELDTNNTEAHHNLAVYYHKKNQPDAALYYYQSAIRLTPNDELLLKNYNSLMTKLGLKTTIASGDIIDNNVEGVQEQNDPLKQEQNDPLKQEQTDPLEQENYTVVDDMRGVISGSTLLGNHASIAQRLDRSSDTLMDGP